MFSIDDRAGNVVTTVGVFAIAATILYLARGAFLVLLLSLLFAYLLEPAVAWVQRHSRLGRGNRTWAIAQVYLAGILLVGSLGFAAGPRLATQVKSFGAAVPQILHDLSTGKIATDLEARHGLGAAEQQRIRDWLAHNHDFMVGVFERGAASAEYVVASAIWWFVVPILAIFILRDGRQVAEAFFQSLEQRQGPTLLTRTVRRVDTMLAKYIRSQLVLAGLSFAFYTIALLVLGFPYAVPLGLLGGILEFLPVVGWLAAAAVMLTIGFLTHAHWIWMAGLVIAWRLIQDYVNAPRIMGDNLELQPLTVLFALMVGGQVAGIAGVYLSVPAAAILRIMWVEYFSSRNSSSSFSEQPAMRAKK
jgi:predicted PurR-regulated permease PerM